MKSKEKQKFKFLTYHGKLTYGMTLAEIMEIDLYLEDYEEAVQYIGIRDAKGTEAYEGDILELKITDELMDHKNNLFYNSNLGKRIEKEGDILSVFCVLRPDHDILGTAYRVHFLTESGMEWYEGRMVPKGTGFDTSFPAYLCEKGAVIAGNILEEPEFFKKYPEKGGEGRS